MTHEEVLKVATERPWTGDEYCTNAIDIVGADNRSLGSVNADFDLEPVDYANAALIVRAVNSHEALVDSLAAMVDEIENLIDDGTLPGTAKDHACMLRAREVLALARGE